MTVPTRHISSLLRDDFVTIEVTLGNSPATYTYKALKTQAAQMAVGSRVVVPGKLNAETGKQSLSIATVAVIHDVPKIDLEATFKYAWIVQVLDLSTWEALNVQEEHMDQKVAEIERRRQIADMKASILNNFSEEERAELFAVPGAHSQITDATVREVPTATKVEG